MPKMRAKLYARWTARPDYARLAAQLPRILAITSSNGRNTMEESPGFLAAVFAGETELAELTDPACVLAARSGRAGILRKRRRWR
jgi:hypothetical protein